MASTKRTWRAGAVAALLCCVAQGAEAAQHADPVQRAKATVKMGEVQLAQVRREVTAEDYGEALRVLKQYRDAIKTAHAALKATGRDAEKKPSGFKNLQIHLRQALQHLDQSILSVPAEERPPFDAIRKELDSIDKELIDALFPRQPSKKQGETKPGR